MISRYRPNPTYEAEVQAEPSFDRSIRRRAKEVAEVVQAVSPRKTDYYARHVKAVGTAVVAGDKSFWHLVEFGSVNNIPYAPLRRGVRAAGLRLVMHPKP